jgi:hypothetical protein
MKPSQIFALLLSFLLMMCANAFAADAGVLLSQNDQRNDGLRTRMEDRKDDPSGRERSHSLKSTKSTIDQMSGLTQCQEKSKSSVMMENHFASSKSQNASVQ